MIVNHLKKGEGVKKESNKMDVLREETFGIGAVL